MISRFIYLLAGFLFYTFQTQAQAYEPGLLVRSNGDTLRGEIENDFWVEPPTLIRFRATSTGPAQLFQPRQLRGVSFEQGRYFRFEALLIDHAAENQLDRLSRGYSPDFRSDSVLAEVLVEGPGSLLRVNLSGMIHYFICRTGQPALDLSERKYLATAPDGTLAVMDANNYRGQLAVCFGDCPVAARVAATAPFTAAGLSSVVQAYNETCNPPHRPGRSWLAQAKPRRRLAFQGGVLVGVRYNHIESLAANLESFYPDSRLRPMAGLYAELFQPSRKVAIYGELSMSSFRSRDDLYSESHIASTGSIIYSIRTYTDYQALLSTARLGVRYYFLLPHEQHLLLGMSYELNSVLNPQFTVITTVETGNPTTTTPVPDNFTDNKLRFATQTLLPSLSLGWRSNRVTMVADGQLYTDRHSFSGESNASELFLGNAWGARFYLSYRLGRNPDQRPGPQRL